MRQKAGFWNSITGKWAEGFERERYKARLGFTLTFFLVAGLFILSLSLLSDLDFVAEVFS